MAEILIKNARVLTCKSRGPKYGEDMQDLGIIEKGFIAIEKGLITDVGSGDGCEFAADNTEIIDAEGKTVMPGLVDPHTHLVHYGSRENELELS
jgi:imidazolonepropionase